MRTRTKVFVIIGSILLGVFLFAAAILVYVDRYGIPLPKVKIFADISEMNALDEYVDAEIDDETKFIRDLSIAGSYCRKIIYDGDEYYVFAYVFSTRAEADLYIEKRSHTDSYQREYLAGKAERVLYIGTNASNKKIKVFKRFLLDHLSETIDKVNSEQFMLTNWLD